MPSAIVRVVAGAPGFPGLTAGKFVRQGAGFILLGTRVPWRPSPLEFAGTEQPAYMDFAYFSFTVGMTSQVSDTTITSNAVRRITLHHALLSYLFGAVLLGLVINVVATLLK